MWRSSTELVTVRSLHAKNLMPTRHRSRPAHSASRGDCPSNSLDLTQVHEVVTCVQLEQVTERFFSPFGMHSDTIKIRRRCALEQSHVGATYQREFLERVVHVRFG